MATAPSPAGRRAGCHAGGATPARQAVVRARGLSSHHIRIRESVPVSSISLSLCHSPAPAPGATGALALLARRLAPADVVLRLPSPRRCCDQGGRPSTAPVSSATCFAFKLARVLARQKKDAAGSSPLGSHPTSFISPEGGRGQRFRALGSKLPASGWDGLVQVAGRGCTGRMRRGRCRR